MDNLEWRLFGVIGAGGPRESGYARWTDKKMTPEQLVFKSFANCNNRNPDFVLPFLAMPANYLFTGMKQMLKKPLAIRVCPAGPVSAKQMADPDLVNLLRMAYALLKFQDQEGK